MTRAADGAEIASRNLTDLNGRSFAVYGLPDGEYELRAAHRSTSGDGAASQPRRIMIKGADVTGLELPLLPLASVSGRLVVETLPPGNRPTACAAERITSLPDTRVLATFDEKGTSL